MDSIYMQCPICLRKELKMKIIGSWGGTCIECDTPYHKFINIDEEE